MRLSQEGRPFLGFGYFLITFKLYEMQLLKVY